MKLGIIREYKIPPDFRTPLIPSQLVEINREGQFDCVVESSPDRCFSDDEYRNAGIPVVNDVSDCELLLGVKEVPVDKLVPDKTYFFFSHTIKEQEYNRDLLRALLDLKIRLIDYEALSNHKGRRLISFGHFAGMVGAHNALMTYGSRTGAFQLPRMRNCRDYEEAKTHYQKVELPPLRIVLTGTGRVATGAAMVLQDMGINQVEPETYLSASFNQAVFTQLDSPHYVQPNNNRKFDRQHFHSHPGEYHSIFTPFTKKSDIMINGIYWDNRAPVFFNAEEMRDEDFAIRVIADITCDIAPASSIPSTLRPSTIEEPVYGYDPRSGREVDPYQPGAIDVMAIDNLPNELPRDASVAFGEQFMAHVLPELLKEESEILERATVTHDGKLGPHFQYLRAFAGIT